MPDHNDYPSLAAHRADASRCMKIGLPVAYTSVRGLLAGLDATLARAEAAEAKVAAVGAALVEYVGPHDPLDEYAGLWEYIHAALRIEPDPTFCGFKDPHGGHQWTGGDCIGSES